MELKHPITIEKQINNLLERGMLLHDKEFAKDVLSNISYYRLSGYALQFREPSSQNKYQDGTTFESIYKIYLFDAKLRNIYLKHLEKVEVRFITQIAYHFSILNCSTRPYDQHYDGSYFRDKTAHNIFIKKMETQIRYYKNTKIVEHHMKKYSDRMPLWAMVEIMSFSNLSYFYKAMRRDEQNTISTIAGVRTTQLINHLHCMSTLRNACAHGSRLYNTELHKPIKLGEGFLKRNRNIENNSLFAYSLVLGRHLPTKYDKHEYLEDLKTLIKQNIEVVDLQLIGFPDDYEQILTKYIGLNA